MKIFTFALLLAALIFSASGCTIMRERRSAEFVALSSGLGCAAVAILADADKEALAAAAVCAAVGYAATSKLEDRRRSYDSTDKFYAQESKKIVDYGVSLDKEIQEYRELLNRQQKNISSLRESSAALSDVEHRRKIVEKDLIFQRAKLNAMLSEAVEKAKYQRGLLAHMRVSEGRVAPSADDQLQRLESLLKMLEALAADHRKQVQQVVKYN